MTPTPDPAAPGPRSFPPFRTPSAAALIAGGAVVLAVFLLLVVGDALPVFVIGLIAAYIMDPLVSAMAARRVPRALATVLAMLLVGAILIVLARVFLDTVVTQFAAFIAGLPAAFEQIEAWVQTLGLNPSVEADVVAWLNSVEQNLASFNITLLFGPLLEGLATVLGSFFTLLTLPFFLFFVLAGRPVLARQVRETLPDAWRGDILTVLGISLNSFGTYIRAETIVATILGVATFVGIMLLSVLVDPAFAEFALLLAIIAFFSEFIPNFGPWIAAIPAVLIALTISPVAVVATILLYLVLMFAEGQVLVPKIEGGAFSFHPALVLFLVVAGVALAGILGAILALPVTAAAWRSARYAFRRASGMGHDEALAWGGDVDLDRVLPAPVPQPSGTAAAHGSGGTADGSGGTAQETVPAEEPAG
jgi:predicted PurR-regulated permease PerM